MNAHQRRKARRHEDRVERRIRLDIVQDARSTALYAAQAELERAPARLLSKSRPALRRLSLGQRLSLAWGVVFP